MTRLRIRHLLRRTGRGQDFRWFWQPSGRLAGQGWRPERLHGNGARPSLAAIERAEELNRQLDAWRAGEAPPHAPARVKGYAPGTLGAAAHAYLRSPEHARLAKNTRDGYRRALATLEAWASHHPLSSITPKRCKVLYRELEAVTPAKAVAVLRVLRVLFAWAISEDLTEENPARAVKLHERPSKGRLWTAEAIAAFAAAADARGWHSIGTAVVLNEWLGQRQGDVLAFARAAWDGEGLTVRQSKTGARVRLPVGMVPRLAARLGQELERQRTRKVEGTTLLLCEATGQAWKADHFRHVFATIRDTAAPGCPALAGMVFMHLRHTAITRLGELGASAETIAAVSGHTRATVNAVLDRYLIRTAAAAEHAFQLRLDSEQSR